MIFGVLKAVLDFARQPIKRSRWGLMPTRGSLTFWMPLDFLLVPGMIHYYIERDDPRMVHLVQEIMAKEGVSKIFGRRVRGQPARA